MTSATQPEDTTAPTDPRSDGSGGGGSGPAAGGPKATVPAQHRGPGGADGAGDGDRTGASDASDGGGEDGESGADTEPGTGTDPGHPAAAPSGGEPRHDGASTVAAPPPTGPPHGRNGRGTDPNA
ncbi:hypothetical protein ACWGG3_30520, partial [Streptomyces sp. NPDC054901]